MEELQRRVDLRCQDVTMPGVRPTGFVVYYVFTVFEFFLMFILSLSILKLLITYDETMDLF